MLRQQYEIWLADLNPQIGTETGKTRPVVIVQTDLLNAVHPSTLVCPLTTNVRQNTHLLRVHLKKGEGGVLQNCDIMVDQIRAIDNRRLLRKIGDLPAYLQAALKSNLMVILDL